MSKKSPAKKTARKQGAAAAVAAAMQHSAPRKAKAAAAAPKPAAKNRRRAGRGRAARSLWKPAGGENRTENGVRETGENHKARLHDDCPPAGKLAPGGE